MSFHEAEEPGCVGANTTVEMVIEPKEKDLGEFSVRRVLPAAEKRMVGPFVFFDHFGRAEFPPGKGIQVRPHPHIGLATISYLFEGEIMHRDSLGFAQPIHAGAVNLMTAGRGIVHSERAGSDLETTSYLHGIQSWMALPEDQQEVEPAFTHYPAADIPGFAVDGVDVRLIMGSAYGHESPVTTYSPIIYLELKLPAGQSIELPTQYIELAAYIVSGDVRIDAQSYAPATMAVACPGKAVRLEATEDSHVMVLGGEPLGKRHVWWNFVSTSRERIEQAKADWTEERFGRVPGDDEFIPLPD